MPEATTTQAEALAQIHSILQQAVSLPGDWIWTEREAGGRIYYEVRSPRFSGPLTIGDVAIPQHNYDGSPVADPYDFAIREVKRISEYSHFAPDVVSRIQAVETNFDYDKARRERAAMIQLPAETTPTAPVGEPEVPTLPENPTPTGGGVLPIAVTSQPVSTGEIGVHSESGDLISQYFPGYHPTGGYVAPSQPPEAGTVPVAPEPQAPAPSAPAPAETAPAQAGLAPESKTLAIAAVVVLVLLAIVLKVK